MKPRPGYEPVEIPDRKKMSKKQRADFFTRHGGICHFCLVKIGAGEKWERSHLKDLELTGDDSDANARPAHIHCHKAYTHGEGNPRIRKAVRLAKKDRGEKPQKFVRKITSRGFEKGGPKQKIPSRPWPGKVL